MDNNFDDYADEFVEELNDDGDPIYVDRTTGLENLGIAIIKQAVKDALKNPSRYYHGVIRFLDGDLYPACTNVDASIIKKYINDELAKRKIHMS